MKCNTKKYLAIATTILACAGIYAPIAHSAACTYDDAVMAFKNNNLHRAKVLLEMAKRDGDKRAVQFLAKHFDLKEKVVLIASK